MDPIRYSFRTEWIDKVADLKRFYILNYYEKSGGRADVEMIDCKSKKLFLKKTPMSELTVDMLFLGAKVTIFGRQLTLIEYEDEATRVALEPRQARCFALLSREAVADVGIIFQSINAAGLKVFKLLMLDLSDSDAREVFGSTTMAGRIVVLELVGPDVIGRWHDVMGELRSSCYSDHFDGLFGVEDSRTAGRYLDAFFGPDRIPSARRSTARLTDCTCCIIKPHAIQEGNAGNILQELASCGLEISAMYMTDISLTVAEEFLEVYKGVIPEYLPLATEVASGPLLALELTGSDAVMRLREIAGPHDIDVGRHVRPKSLRAVYGTDTVKNAVHVTDLPEDGVRDCEYFFSILHEM